MKITQSQTTLDDLTTSAVPRKVKAKGITCMKRNNRRKKQVDETHITIHIKLLNIMNQAGHMTQSVWANLLCLPPEVYWKLPINNSSNLHQATYTFSIWEACLNIIKWMLPLPLLRCLWICNTGNYNSQKKSRIPLFTQVPKIITNS